MSEAKRPRFNIADVAAAMASASAEEPVDENPPSEILEGFLFLGDFDNASRVRQLQHFGITHVLNITQSRDIGTEEGVERLFLKADDAETEVISLLFPAACAFIDRAKREDGRVLVHCMAGRSRSATLVIAYLMRHQQYRLIDAFAFVKQCRPIVLPNIGFWEQLVAEEIRLFGTPSKTPACYEFLTQLRRGQQEMSPAGAFQRFCAAFVLEGSAESEAAQQIVLQQWPEGWPGAKVVEEVVLASLEHLHDAARRAGVQLIKQLLEAGKLARPEVTEGLARVEEADLADMRLDIPKVDSYLEEVVQEATRLDLVRGPSAAHVNSSPPQAAGS